MIIIIITNGMLLVEDSSVLLQVRCHCTSGVGWSVWKDVEWAVYISPLPTVYAAVYDMLECVLYM